MTISELMERAGMKESGLALAMIKDAFHLIQSNSTEDTKTVNNNGKYEVENQFNKDLFTA